MSFNPEPSYHLCPSFGLSPPPKGHLDLGTIVQSLDIDGVEFPVNQDCRVPVPEVDRYPHDGTHEKQGFTRKLKELRATRASIWAKIFSLVGAQFGFLCERSDDETLTVEKLCICYFIPSKEYMERALEQSHVIAYLDKTAKRGPLYMVTGYMYAEGASITKVKNKQGSLLGKTVATELTSSLTAGAGAGYSGDESSTVGFLNSSPFMLGLRVRKIWWDKDGSKQTSDDVAGAVLGASGSSQRCILDGIQYKDDWTPEGNYEQLNSDNGNKELGLESSVWAIGNCL
jgi:hypothetical protein